MSRLAHLGLAHPILLAPLGGGASTPELAAAVSSAGGLGTLGAAYLSPEQILAAASRTRSLTDRPFGINLFAGGHETDRAVDPVPMTELLAEVHAELGLPPPGIPPVVRDPFPDQLAAVLEARPALFSFTFGIPSADALAACRALDIVTAGTATTVAEACALEDAGVDIIVAQGAEAGAHRGTFLDTFERSLVPTRVLVREIAASVPLPLVASGGLMDGRDIAEMLALGADAAALGTAFLVCPESGAPAAHKQAILSAREDRTRLTRAFSGRPARGIPNAFMSRVDDREEIILPYPLQNAFTRAMRTAAAQRGLADFLSLWAGTGAPRARVVPASALVETLVRECTEEQTARAPTL